MTDNDTSATDKIVKAAKDLGLPPKAEEYIRSADKTITEVVHKAAVFADENREKLAGYVDENRGKLAEYVEKAGAFVDEKTEGKYHDKVSKAQDAANSAVAKLATHRDAAAAETASDAAGDFTPPSAVGEDEPSTTGSTDEGTPTP